MDLATLPRYDERQTYQWNYDHAPQHWPRLEIPPVPGRWTFCGLPVASPLGMPAGPLLNGRWCLYYAHLGFDVLTYKTVRSCARACYPLPNLLPVHCGPLLGGQPQLLASQTMLGSWAVSFGMPSMEPEVWRRDVERTRRALPAGKLLVVSVVGTVTPTGTLDDLAADYARCAGWARDSGADCVEANFSCPNVSTCDGQLYQQPEHAALVAQHIRQAIGRLPLLIKIGHVSDAAHARSLLDQVGPYVDGLSMTNSVTATVADSNGQLYFAGQPRGICGQAVRDASVAQTAMFVEIRKQLRASWFLVGVGGVGCAQDVHTYLDAGADAVQVASAAMTSPDVGLQIKREWKAAVA